MRIGLTALIARATVLSLIALTFGAATLLSEERNAGVLESWNDGAAKRAIIDFVVRVTKDGGAEFVPQAQRIAVFDNDGTLWAEQPLYFQLAFAIDRIKSLAPEHPGWTTTEPFKSILAGDVETALATGEKGVAQIVAATHAGMTTEKFGEVVDEWLANAKHPKTQRPYTEMVYQPMLELLLYLRDNGFKTYIVSGGGVEFMRRFAEDVYGIPPEQVVGSSGVVTFEIGDGGKPELIKQPEIEFVDDGSGKPVGINRFIGRRPIFAFGNSDGDLQMLQYTAAGNGARFAGIVHHTDSDREWAYDRASHIGKLDKALSEAVTRGWSVVDMKADWRTIFPEKR
ncbi:MAG: HAD family hydrolase [Hyphomicrobium sp.]|uniref:HAD family hydrolase n=1 Tax=Hyphomicrobium sp. TaxID=82 RepID=UPI0039E443AA